MDFLVAMTAENYAETINLLNKHYANTHVQISGYVKNFVNFPSVKSINNFLGLQIVFEKLVSSARTSKRLNVDLNSYIFLVRY